MAPARRSSRASCRRACQLASSCRGGGAGGGRWLKEAAPAGKSAQALRRHSAQPDSSQDGSGPPVNREWQGRAWPAGAGPASAGFCWCPLPTGRRHPPQLAAQHPQQQHACLRAQGSAAGPHRRAATTGGCAPACQKSCLHVATSRHARRRRRGCMQPPAECSRTCTRQPRAASSAGPRPGECMHAQINRWRSAMCRRGGHAGLNAAVGRLWQLPARGLHRPNRTGDAVSAGAASPWATSRCEATGRGRGMQALADGLMQRLLHTLLSLALPWALPLGVGLSAAPSFVLQRALVTASAGCHSVHAQEGDALHSQPQWQRRVAACEQAAGIAAAAIAVGAMLPASRGAGGRLRAGLPTPVDARAANRAARPFAPKTGVEPSLRYSV